MRNSSVGLIWIIFALGNSAQGSAPLSLDDAFNAAVNRSETIGQQGELIIQAQEHHDQVFGGILPNVSGFASYQKQETTSRTSSISPSSQPLIKLSATQPLFRGLREFAGLRQTNLLVDSQKSAERAARVQVYNDLALNFYQILSAEQDLVNLKKEKELYHERIKDLRSRAAIGRSRASEALSIEASLATLTAQEEQVRAQLASYRETFAFLTGLPRESALKDEPMVPPTLKPMDEYLQRIDARPDVSAARGQRDASEEAIAIAKGAHLPSADLTGNYYLKRYGTNEDVKWDLIASLTIPIYVGGTIQSHVREASSQQRFTELGLVRTRRFAEDEIRTAYQNVAADRIQLEAFARAKELSDKNYQAQTRDYRLGLVTNLDVLQALVTLQEAERSLDKARYSARYNFARLQTASAERGN